VTNEYEKLWYERAACKGLSEFFDTDCGDSSIPHDQLVMMKKICAGCPVLEECLADTLHFSDEYTFRAGMTATERKRLMRKLGIRSWTRKQMQTMESGATWYSRLRS
jgi:WhiB family redox-sensing transcriptional regulator